MAQNLTYPRTKLSKLLGLLTPFLALPGLVLLGLSIILGPDVWSAAYASVVGFCRMHMADISLGRVALGLTLLLGILSLTSGGFAALRELRRLRLLAQTIALHGSSDVVSEEDRFIIVRDDAPFAFCHGILRPRIYYSTGLARLLTDAELRAVLLHEKLHAKQYDPLRVFTAHILTAMFFFFPLSRVMRDRYLAWLEIRADQEVVRQLGVAALARALVKLLQPTPALDMKAAVSRINPTEERIKYLIDPGAGPAHPLIPPIYSLANVAMVVITGLMAIGISHAVGMLLMSMRLCQVPFA